MSSYLAQCLNASLKLPLVLMMLFHKEKHRSAFLALTRRREEGHSSEAPHKVIILTCPSVMWPLRLVRLKSQFNKTLILPCLPKTLVMQHSRFNLCEDGPGATAISRRKDITHRRSPRSWRTPWPSKACSLSPSPEKGDKMKGKGRRQERGVGEWNMCKLSAKPGFFCWYLTTR